MRRALASREPVGPVEVLSWTCNGVEDADPQGLNVTYWFDAAPAGEPYSVRVRFVGRRLSAREAGSGAESFDVVESLQDVVPGTGRIALSARIPGLAAGEWEVRAVPASGEGGSSGSSRAMHAGLMMPRGSATGRTIFLPTAKVLAPGVRIGAWPALVGLGALVALGVQGLLGARWGVPNGRLLAVSLVACVLGLGGAKAYYVLTHRQEGRGALSAGLSVQGFVITAVATLGLGSWLAALPLGALLDATGPGLLFGLTVGRLGCFFGGCCAGRPTASRWGIWSSDRRVGVRRIPVQLMESALAALVGIAALVAALVSTTAHSGLILVAGLAAYIAGRQLLFPLRDIPRATSWGRVTTLVAGLIVLAGTLAAAWLSSRA